MKKITITFSVLFVICLALFPLLYCHYLYYKNDTEEELNRFFQQATQSDIFTEATDTYNKYYNDLDYGIAVSGIAALDYQPMPEKDALRVLLTQPTAEQLYQVNVYFYSAADEEKKLINLLFFCENDTVYALAFFDDETTKSGQSITLYLVHDDIPEELEKPEFQGNDLFGRTRKIAMRYTLKNIGWLILTLVFAFLEGILILRLRQSALRNDTKHKNRLLLCIVSIIFFFWILFGIMSCHGNGVMNRVGETAQNNVVSSQNEAYAVF